MTARKTYSVRHPKPGPQGTPATVTVTASSHDEALKAFAFRAYGRGVPFALSNGEVEVTDPGTGVRVTFPIPGTAAA